MKWQILVWATIDCHVLGSKLQIGMQYYTLYSIDIMDPQYKINTDSTI